MASPEPQPKGLPTLVYWVFPYSERTMGHQGQRGILVPDGYNYVSFGERRCNIKGRMKLVWKNESALEELGLSNVFTGAIGAQVRYDLPNYVLQGVMVNARGVTAVSNYLCFMDNVLISEQATYGLNAALGVSGTDTYLFSYETSAGQLVQTYSPWVVGSNQYVSLPARQDSPNWPQNSPFEPGANFRLNTIQGAHWGSVKSFTSPFYRETPRYPLSDRRIEIELWAPASLNLELTVYPTNDQGSYTYLWPGEKISEWVNINPMSGTMPIKQFYYAKDKGLIQIAEYSYEYTVDYFLEVKLHASLE